MKELLSIKEKAHRYDKALRVVEKLHSSWKETQNRAADEIEEAFPELRESEDEKIRKELIEFIRHGNCVFDSLEQKNKFWAWLEKQGSNLVENGYTNNKDIIKYADIYSHAIWLKLMDNFKNVKDYYIGCNDVSDIVLNAIIDAYNWLEKQGEQKLINNADDEAEKYAKTLYCSNLEAVNDIGNCSTCENVKTAFKAGLEKQGEQKSEEEVDNLHNYLYGGQKPADKVESISKDDEDESIRKDIIAYMRYERKSTEEEIENRFIPWLEKRKTTEEALQYLKENHSPSEVSDFQAAMNIAVAKAYNKGYTDGLEKQEEQKSADKFEPKFNVGDWLVCCNYEPEQIIGIRNDMYEMSNGDIRPIKMVNKNHNIRLWTIKDVKVGDVLSFNDGHGNDGIELVKSITDKKIEFWFCLTNGSYYEVFDGITPYTNFASREKARPATKEQRDLLFQKLKEAGYEWDAEKKEMRKIEQKPADTPKFKVGDWVINSEGKIRHIMSVDESGYQTDYGWLTHDGYERVFHLWTIQDAKDGDVLANNGNVILFKEISNSARKDYKYIKSHCLVLAHSFDFYTGGSYNLDDGFHPATKEQRDLLFSKMKKAGYEWDEGKKVLEKIEQKPQSKQEWSEEDDRNLSIAIQYVFEHGYLSTVDWLKSLKDRVQQQPKWSETAG